MLRCLQEAVSSFTELHVLNIKQYTDKANQNQLFTHTKQADFILPAKYKKTTIADNFCSKILKMSQTVKPADLDKAPYKQEHRFNGR